jgi:hypothetical protein
MKSVAESLTVDEEEVRKAIMLSIPNHKFYKVLFGFKKLFNTLSDEELKLAFLQVISKEIAYNENDKHFKIKMGWIKENEEGVEVVLTNEQILEIYK